MVSGTLRPMTAFKLNTHCRRDSTIELSRVGGVNASVVSRRELVANSVYTADAGGVYGLSYKL